jgi:predicted nucleotidyltransferase
MKVGHLEVDERALASLCRKWKIAKLEAFGSVLRDDFRPESDVDLLVSYEDGSRKRFDDQLSAVEDFQKLFGREVELVPRKRIEASENYIRRHAILTTAKVVYGS